MRQRAVTVLITAALSCAVLTGCSAISVIAGNTGSTAEEGATASPPPATERLLQIDDPPTIGSYTVSPVATIKSDEDFETTTLKISATKIDNSIASGMSTQIRFGETICRSQRPYLVYAADGRGGKLFEGEQGFHVLSCRPFVAPANLASLPNGRVE